MTSDHSHISIHSCNGQFFIWNIDEIKYVRKVHRVVGNFIGSPNLSGIAYQNKVHGPPLKLLNEECLFLLSECPKARLVKQNLNDQSVVERCAKEFEEFEAEFREEYRPLYDQHSIELIKQKLDLIVKGKASKNNVPVDRIDREQILDEEIKKIKPLSDENQPKQLLIQSPWSSSFEVIDFEFEDVLNEYYERRKRDLMNLDEMSHCDVMMQCDETAQNETTKNTDKPRLRNEHSLLRYLVYKDLNERGLYLVNGSKFGSDLLAYPTDPLFCHAQYLVVCLSENQKLTKTLLQAYTRLGSQVNKNFILVRFRSDVGDSNVKSKDDLEYMVIKWQSEI